MSQSKARPQPDWNAAEAIVKSLLLKVAPQVTDSWGELGFSSNHKESCKTRGFYLVKGSKHIIMLSHEMENKLLFNIFLLCLWFVFNDCQKVQHYGL